MGPWKKTLYPKSIKSRLFSSTDLLTVEDFAILSVDSFGSQAAELLDELNWSKEVFSLTGIRLAPDNRRIVSSTVFLLGSIFKNKPFNAGNFWNFTTPTTLTLSIKDASVFPFLNRSLCSEFLDSSTFKFSFKQGETTISTEAQIEAGINGFSIRALFMPIPASKSKLWITIVPISLTNLLTPHPLATIPAFPSLKLIVISPLTSPWKRLGLPNLPCRSPRSPPRGSSQCSPFVRCFSCSLCNAKEGCPAKNCYQIQQTPQKNARASRPWSLKTQRPSLRVHLAFAFRTFNLSTFFR